MEDFCVGLLLAWLINLLCVYIYGIVDNMHMHNAMWFDKACSVYNCIYADGDDSCLLNRMCPYSVIGYDLKFSSQVLRVSWQAAVVQRNSI